MNYPYMGLNHNATPFEMTTPSYNNYPGNNGPPPHFGPMHYPPPPQPAHAFNGYGDGYYPRPMNDGIILTSAKPDWSRMDLAKFPKNFYIESPLVRNRSPTDIQSFYQDNQVTVDGTGPRPVFTFAEANFPEPVMETIAKAGFQKPTLIQSCAWPILLSGVDLIGIALTGSGKTLAFILPGIVHASHQEFVKPGDGPIVLVMAPTRELVQQIYTVAHEFGKLAQCRTAVIFGGVSKGPQRTSLLSGVEVVIGTPGRLLDFIQEGTLKLDRITYLVLDEADRMLDMGFEPQIRQICERVRSDRQTSMFSATWPKDVRQLANSFLSSDRIHVTIGNVILAANPSICQIIEVCTEAQKQNRLVQLLNEIMALRDAKTLVFCQTKRRVDDIYHMTKQMGFPVLCIHGDKQQSQRDFTMGEFRRRRKIIMIATDVAARGIDIQDIQFVVNLDFPNQTEDYVHRIGRTARNTEAVGTSYTFFTAENAKQAPSLVRVLQEAGQKVSQDLMEMAEDQRYVTGSKYGSKFRTYNGNNQQRLPLQRQQQIFQQQYRPTNNFNDRPTNSSYGAAPTPHQPYYQQQQQQYIPTAPPQPMNNNNNYFPPPPTIYG